jgi:hypothetical protein
MLRFVECVADISGEAIVPTKKIYSIWFGIEGSGDIAIRIFSVFSCCSVHATLWLYGGAVTLGHPLMNRKKVIG